MPSAAMCLNGSLEQTNGSKCQTRNRHFHRLHGGTPAPPRAPWVLTLFSPSACEQTFWLPRGQEPFIYLATRISPVLPRIRLVFDATMT